mmetsp:Transcript_2734/g.6138  ORF Transcript_2734/g.6138 Transcript_2734/m.6138 type:complete len:163 (+) Transcript_2734:68-556(+)
MFAENPAGGSGKQNGRSGHGKWRKDDFIEATHDQKEVHKFGSLPPQNIMGVEGLHTSLRCGNGDRDRYMMAHGEIIEISDLIYDAVLKVIDPKMVPLGVTGLAGPELFHFVSGYKEHLPAAFRDYFSAELMDLLLEYAASRDFLLRVVGQCSVRGDLACFYA